MSDAFPKASFLRSGYAPGYVDAFLEGARGAYEGGVPAERFSSEQVRQAVFPLKRNGYRMDAVDTAMNRLGAVFVRHDRLDHVVVDGEATWLGKIVDRATTLYDRLLRPRSGHFAHPQKGRGYDVVAVDDLPDRLAAYFDEGRPLSVNEMRTAVFKPVRGKKGYLERPVDAYLGRAAEVLLAAE